jgi:hypothetical protein
MFKHREKLQRNIVVSLTHCSVTGNIPILVFNYDDTKEKLQNEKVILFWFFIESFFFFCTERKEKKMLRHHWLFPQ